MILVEIIESLEAMNLNRTLVDCKRYDRTTISYNNNTGFAILINGTDRYSNIRQIILYENDATINLIIQSYGLINSKVDIENIESIIKTEQ